MEKLFLTFRTIFVHNMFSPWSAKRRASNKDLPVRFFFSVLHLFFYSFIKQHFHKITWHFQTIIFLIRVILITLLKLWFNYLKLKTRTNLFYSTDLFCWLLQTEVTRLNWEHWNKRNNWLLLSRNLLLKCYRCNTRIICFKQIFTTHTLVWRILESTISRFLLWIF